MARPEKDKHDRREPRSVSLVPAHWKYLEALAEDLRAERAGDGDPMGERATVSEAVRHLIARDLITRQKDELGRPVFVAGLGRTRAVDMATGTTSVSASPSPSASASASASPSPAPEEGDGDDEVVPVSTPPPAPRPMPGRPRPGTSRFSPSQRQPAVGRPKVGKTR